MAAISKSSNGKWRVRISWYDSTGTRRFKSKAGFSTKAEASRWARSMEIKKDDSTITDKSVSFAQYFDEWFRTYKENKISYITAGKYRVIQSKLSKFLWF